MYSSPANFESIKLTGRNRRLLNEWKKIDERIGHLKDITYTITKTNYDGLPVVYSVQYNIKSFCGVENVDKLNEKEVVNRPLFASVFRMEITIPENYPSIDAPAEFRFLTKNEMGEPISHPWHPNIRFFGDFEGRVCINTVDSYTDLVWYIERVALYLSYDLYHAISEPPYPEDFQVAQWVIRQAERNGWLNFNMKE